MILSLRFYFWLMFLTYRDAHGQMFEDVAALSTQLFAGTNLVESRAKTGLESASASGAWAKRAEPLSKTPVAVDVHQAAFADR
jgi:hypothetical protein